MRFGHSYMDTYNVSCPKEPYDVRGYLDTYNLGTAVEGRVGSLTRDQDSQAFPTRGANLWSLQTLPLPGDFPPPTQAGQRSNSEVGQEGPGPPVHVAWVRKQGRGAEKAANTFQARPTAGWTPRCTAMAPW